ncbi:hypothetical protein PFISCL1PPCAC_6635, partial [Pristionchus fissidentatus]
VNSAIHREFSTKACPTGFSLTYFANKKDTRMATIDCDSTTGRWQAKTAKGSNIIIPSRGTVVCLSNDYKPENHNFEAQQDLKIFF